MNGMLDRLLSQLDARGLQIKAGDKPGELKIAGPKTEVTPEVLAALKEFKPDLLKRFAASDLPTEQRADAIAEAAPVPQ